MWHHFVNLLIRSWAAMVKATGTTTLGFIVWTLAFTTVGWIFGAAANWFELRRKGTASPLHEALARSFWPQGAFLAAGILALVICVYSAFLIRTVYWDHETLTTENRVLAAANAALNRKMSWRTHNISTTDPVFPNIISLLEAFHSYRHYAQGETCVIRVTAPPDSMPLASAVSQFSNSVSDCFTFGPDAVGNPDTDDAATSGMVPGMIVFHADRDDKAADQLFNLLGNQIQLRRSYKPIPPAIRNFSIPTKGKVRVIWLQFGPGVVWNSELFSHKK